MAYIRNIIVQNLVFILIYVLEHYYEFVCIYVYYHGIDE